MQGDIDSMNVSVAAGILVFEAKRQRNFLWKFINNQNTIPSPIINNWKLNL
jgi:ABC-type proline/glycine betaine transport system permease subunit